MAKESYKDDVGVTHSHTDWHSIVAWRSLAEVIGKYLHKGSQYMRRARSGRGAMRTKRGRKSRLPRLLPIAW